MGTLSRTLLVACALIAGSVVGAAAADFRFPPEPVTPVPEAIAIPDYSNLWYLRGDVGYSINEDPDLSLASASFNGEKMDESWSIGAGFGYNFTDNIRGDLTLDHRFEADVTGSNSVTSAQSTIALASTVGLANLYYDFRDREHFAPYLGAGIGWTYNETDAQIGAASNDESFELALAAMAGFSYRLDDGWLFDAGYRFLYLGDAQTGSTATAGAVSIEDIYAHELRVGFRYELQ
jgi:opacity protein-like surface antigen